MGPVAAVPADLADLQVIWGTAILADAVVRVLMAFALPIGVVPALGGALWPVTFAILQGMTNIYFARAGLWRILITGQEQYRPGGHPARAAAPAGHQHPRDAGLAGHAPPNLSLTVATFTQPAKPMT